MNTIRMKKHPMLLTAVLVSCLSIAGIMQFGLVQGTTSEEPSFEISGYILDSNGCGIAGAMVIFNVPEKVPAVYSNSSGYYAISAPAGIYHINAWPPFDSNYIFYDEPEFVVESDLDKNITLTSGYKVSGYITDSDGNPVKDGVVSLGDYLSGWFSKNSGYYFVCAPAGIYKLRAAPRSGYSHFAAYYEHEFIVDENIAKNITVDALSPTPKPTPSPCPEPKTCEPKPTLTLNCSSSISNLGFEVNIQGNLKYNNTALSDSQVLIYYSVTGGKSWIELTSVITNEEGDFSAVWLPSVTGNFLVKAYYLGNEDYCKTKTIVNLAVTSYDQEENVFSVSSNSTLSGLSFNSEELELRFSVSGDNGTFGYVNVYIPKSLIKDVSKLEVYLDEKQIDYFAESAEDYWLLRFSYSHSSHEISVLFSSLALQDAGSTLASWVSYAGIASLAVIGAILAIFFVKGKKQVQI